MTELMDKKMGILKSSKTDAIVVQNKILTR